MGIVSADTRKVLSRRSFLVKLMTMDTTRIAISRTMVMTLTLSSPKLLQTVLALRFLRRFASTLLLLVLVSHAFIADR
jgi:hypothetical protein